jgi:hypothetical protein
MSVPTLTTREAKGARLSNPEIDANWEAIKAAFAALDVQIGTSLNPDGTLKVPPVMVAISQTGTQDYVATVGLTLATYEDAVGVIFLLKPDFTNTSDAATLKLNGLSAVTIRKNRTQLLAAGDITTDEYNIIISNGTHFVLVNPASAGQGNYDGTVPNGSFELDSDSDSVPDEWVKTLPWPGGSFAIEGTDVIHGAKAIRFTHPGGSGNGGGYITSKNFIECTEKRLLILKWLHKSSVAGMLDKVEVIFYDRVKAQIGSPTVAYTSTTNPTTWTEQSAVITPPSTARFFKIQITGGDVSVTTGGTSYWDGVEYSQLNEYSELAASTLADGVLTFTHGLGVKPREVDVTLECTTTDEGWAVGDEVPVGICWIESGSDDGVGGADTAGKPAISWGKGTTAVTVIVHNISETIFADKANLSRPSITPGSWKVRVRAKV